MEWYKYYDMFNLINEHIEKEVLTKETINIYGGYPFATKNFIININILKEHATHHFEYLKNNYIEKTKTQNIYSSIDSELKGIIVNFTNNKFTYPFVSNEEQKILFYYEIDTLINDLKEDKLKGEAENSQTFCRLWASTMYWLWLHQQSSTYQKLLHYRPFNIQDDNSDKKGTLAYRKDNDLILEIILTNNDNPFDIIEELTLYLDNIQKDSTRIATIFKIKKIAYDYYQKDKKKHIKALPLATINLSKDKEELNRQYIQIIDFLNKVYGIDTNSTSIKEEITQPTQNQKLIWNGQKNVIADIFYQLKNMYVKKGGKQVPLIDNSFDEIALFLKANFSCFEKTRLSTIETTLTKEDNKPTKSTAKISLVQGFSDN